MKYRNIEMRGIQFVRKNDHEKKKKIQTKNTFFFERFTIYYTLVRFASTIYMIQHMSTQATTHASFFPDTKKKREHNKGLL